jgi:DNA-binding MarR family transcriptional regulator
MGGAIGVSALGTALSHQVSGSVVAGLTKVGVNASAATNSQSLPDLSRLPAPVRLIFEQAFGDATGHIFLIATPFALLTLLRQVRRAAVARARLIHPELQLAGYAVLVWLAAHDGARSADVANALDMDKGAVSRQIDHLERLRLVKRVIDPHDKRAHGLTLTPAGSSRIAALRARGRADLQEISRLGRTASATTPRRRLPAGIAHQVHLRDDCTQSLCMRN